MSRKLSLYFGPCYHGASAATESVVVTATKRHSTKAVAVTEDTLEDLAIGNFGTTLGICLTSLQAEEVQDKIQPTFEEWLLSRLRSIVWGWNCSERSHVSGRTTRNCACEKLRFICNGRPTSEVLPGPQGLCLARAAKQGRFAITNKPEFDGFVSILVFRLLSMVVRKRRNVLFFKQMMVTLRAAMYSAEEGYIDNTRNLHN